MKRSVKERLASPSPQLEERLSSDQLEELLALFRSRHGRGHPRTRGRMSTHEFRAHLARLLGREETDDAIVVLSAKMDGEEQEYVTEVEFCSHILQYLQEKDSLTHTRSQPFQDLPSFKHCPYSKTPLCRLMPASNPPRCITVSKDGAVTSWSPSLQLQGGKMVGGRDGVGRGVLHVTDCAVMQNCNKLVTATTSRELMFFDLTTAAYKCQYKVYDLPYMALCLNYSYDAKSSHLLYGDETGSVTLLTFHSPHLDLFHQPTGQGKGDDTPTLLIAFNHLSTDHRDCLSVQAVPGCHGDWVSQVQYIPHNQCVLSCASSSSASILLRHVGRKRKTYTFRIRKGVSCFDYSHSLELLVSGGMDHLVRLWNPYVPSKPTAVLQGQSTTVQDLLIYEEAGLLFSLAQDLALCVWDIYTHELVQSVSIKFPFTQRLPEFGPSSLRILHTDTLIVMCNEYMAELRLTSAVGGVNRSTATSHAHPITAVLYNAHLHQVVSGCEGGVVNVWDMQSGRHILRFTECHGSQEITAMAFDGMERRLITASQSGEVKVWSYMNRACLKQMTVPGAAEVTGLLHFLDKSRFLAVGWNRRITTFPDEPDVFNVKPDEYWSGENHHKDDILCVAYCPPHYLATGSFDGEIIIWNVDTEKVVSRFHSITRIRPKLLKGQRQASLVRRTPAWSRSSTSTPSRPSSRRLSSYRMKTKLMELQHVPVDQVLFLRSRVKARVTGVATLVSSEGGNANFMDIFGKKDPVGSIPLTQWEDETVLAMTVDPEDQTLLTGDTAGFIAIFDISDFCSVPSQDSIIPDPLVRWRAHSGEVLSIEHVHHDLQPLILSGSGDCTAKLWTMNGQCIGTFGQEQVWNLGDPSTFQHHSEVHISNSTDPDSIQEPREPSGEDTVLPTAPTEDREIIGAENGSSPVSSDVNLSPSVPLPSSLTTKSLGQPYHESSRRRMVDRAERRVQFAKVNIQSTERFGLLCTPYQALQLLKVDEPIPNPSPPTDT